MDDFLSKPIDRSILENKINQWMKGEATRDSSAKKEKSVQSAEESIRSALKELNLEGQPDLLNKIIRTFRAHVEKLMTEVDETIATANTERLSVIAHTLKGSSRSMGAEKLGSLFEKVEKTA